MKLEVYEIKWRMHKHWVIFVEAEPKQTTMSSMYVECNHGTPILSGNYAPQRGKSRYWEYDPKTQVLVFYDRQSDWLRQVVPAPHKAATEWVLQAITEFNAQKWEEMEYESLRAAFASEAVEKAFEKQRRATYAKARRAAKRRMEALGKKLGKAGTEGGGHVDAGEEVAEAISTRI